MHYYREVMTDDPFRRSEREDPSGTADDTGKGYLSGLRRPAGNSSTSCRPARPRDRRNWSAVARRRSRNRMCQYSFTSFRLLNCSWTTRVVAGSDAKR